MPRLVKPLSRVLLMLALAGCISGCTGWVERQVETAGRAIDCAVLATAPTPATAQTAHCDRHPAIRG